MDDIFERYLLGFDEINRMMAVSYQTALSDYEAATDQSAVVMDDLLSLLILAYESGFSEATEQLGAGSSEIDIDDLEEVLFVLIDGMTFEDRVAAHVEAGDSAALLRLAESEYHRVYNAGRYQAALRYENTAGRSLVKRWVTMRDESVRDTHRYLDGMAVGLAEMFYTVDGDYAPYPGAFRKAQNNVGCRCVLFFDLV